MKRLMTAAIAAVLIGSLAGSATVRADEDCDTVVKALNEAISIAAKNLDTTMGELKTIMSQPADDKRKATVKNRFCSSSGELLGTSKASRAVIQECGGEHRAALASLDKSIAEMEGAIDRTCQ